MAINRLMCTGSFVLVLNVAGPADAQESSRSSDSIVQAARACGNIADVVERAGCYDRALGLGSNAVPVKSEQSEPVTTNAALPAGFGSERLIRRSREARSSTADEVEVQVAAIRSAEPGEYILSLANGAQWRFVDLAGFSFAIPQEGDVIRLRRGALGGIFMHFDGQRGLRVERVR